MTTGVVKMLNKTIFMIHGMWGGGWYWENYKKFFESEGFRCVTTTLRYHDVNPGSPPNPALGYLSIRDYVADLRKEIIKLDDKPLIMGHSMGGLLAQILGSLGLAEALILLAPASPAGINAIRPSVIKSFWSIQTKWGFWKKPMRQTFDEAVYSMLHLLPGEEQKKVYSKFVYESGRAAFEIGYWFFDSTGATRVDETKINCPVLVVSGSEDRITPPQVVRKVAKKYKKAASYKEFNDHAHWLISEPGWEEVASFVNGWLKKI